MKKNTTSEESTFQIIFEQSPISTQIFSPDGTLIKVNKAWEKLWDMKLKDIAGYNILKDKQLIHAKLMPLIKRAFKGETVMLPPTKYEPDKTIEGVSKVTYRWTQSLVYAIKNEDGKVIKIVLQQEDITEQKDSEENLRISNLQAQETSNLLTTILETAPIGFCLFDKDLRYVMINKMLANINGISPENHVGKTIQEIVPTINDEATKQLRKVLKTGKPLIGIELSGETSKKPGMKRHWIEDYFPVRSVKGDVIGIGALVVEVTEQKRAKERQDFMERVATKLASSFDEPITLQEVAKLIVPYLADFSRIAIINKDNEIDEITVNHYDPTRITLAENMYEQYKNRPETTHGLPIILKTGKSEIIDKIDKSVLAKVKNNSQLIKTIKQLGLKSYMGVPLIARGKVIGAMTFSSVQENRYYKKEDLKFAEELANRIALALDNIRLFKEAQEEIRERKHFEDNLMRSREQYKLLIDRSPLPMAVHTGGTIVYTNQAAAKLIGAQSPKDLIGQNVIQFVHPEYRDIVKKRVEQIYKNNRRYTDIIEEKFIRLDGEVIDVEIASLLVEYEGKPGIQVIIRDITQQKRLEQQKDEFLGIASHELKTPVTSLKAYGQVLQSRFAKEGNERSAIMVAKMDAQINKLTNLISDLLDISKIEGGRLQFHNEYFAFDELVSEIVEEIQRTTDKHDLIIEGKSGKTINGDRERIGQVLTNFLTNAIKYSPHSAKIIIHTTLSKNEVAVSVKDFGVGIPQDTIAQVFDRFYRVKGKTHDTVPGMGLGLYIASEIIKRQGGRIWAESEKGKGSTFCFALPLKGGKKIQQKNTLVIEEMKHE